MSKKACGKRAENEPKRKSKRAFDQKLLSDLFCLVVLNQCLVLLPRASLYEDSSLKDLYEDRLDVSK